MSVANMELTSCLQVLQQDALRRQRPRRRSRLKASTQATNHPRLQAALGGWKQKISGE